MLHLKLALIQVFLVIINRHRIPVSSDVFINDSLHFVVVLRVKNSRRSRAKLERYVIAFTDAASWEFEPVGEYASAFVARVVREEAMETKLLLASEKKLLTLSLNLNMAVRLCILSRRTRKFNYFFYLYRLWLNHHPKWIIKSMYRI